MFFKNSSEDPVPPELKEPGTNRTSQEAAKAIAFCVHSIREYDWWFNWNETRWIAWQKVAIISGVLATLAAVVNIPESWISLIPDSHALAWLRGIPAALTTVAVGYLANFTYKEDAVRHEVTANALLNELAKFQTEAEPYNGSEKDDTSLFLNNICKLIDNELVSWRDIVIRPVASDSKNPSSKPDLTNPSTP